MLFDPKGGQSGVHRFTKLNASKVNDKKDARELQLFDEELKKLDSSRFSPQRN